MKCDEGETYEARIPEVPKSEALDKHISAKRLVIALGHMNIFAEVKGDSV
jgi:hypothetical protein